MSVIKVTLPPGEIPAEGKQVSFKAPCTCTVTDAIQIDGVDYTVCDALGKCVTGIGGVWDVDSIVSVILSPEQKKAYVQNNASYSPANKPTPTEIGAVSDAGSGSYTGNAPSTSSPGTSKTLTFSKAPKIVLVYSDTNWAFFAPGMTISMCHYFNNIKAGEDMYCSLSGATLTFWQPTDASAGHNGAWCLNYPNRVHYYVAFG